MGKLIDFEQKRVEQRLRTALLERMAGLARLSQRYRAALQQLAAQQGTAPTPPPAAAEVRPDASGEVDAAGPAQDAEDDAD